MNKINDSKKRYLKRYEIALKDLQKTIKLELKGIKDEIFAPSSVISAQALDLIQENQKLKAVLELENE